MPETNALLTRTAHSQRAHDYADCTEAEEKAAHLADLVLSAHAEQHPGPARWCTWEACQVAAAYAGVGPDKPC